MKEKIFSILLMSIITISATGCGTAQTTPMNNDAKQDTVISTEQDASYLTGTIDEMKDSMFVVATDDGAYYIFDRSVEGAEAINDFKEGDKVTISYSGSLTEVDAFTGTILSIQKQ